MSKSILEFKDIKKFFGITIVLENFNLKINENEILAILGKSGSGKSTIIKILLGLVKPEGGDLLYENKNISKERKILKKIVGYVSQENSFYEKLTVQENINFFGKLYGVSKKDITNRTKHLLSLVKLESAKDIVADKLSGGMKRRLEFAISLIHNPQILILDEPFSGLDIDIRDDLWHVLKEIRDSQVTVIIITHLLSSVEKHANRAVILHKKRIQEEILLKSSKHKLEEKFKEVISR